MPETCRSLEAPQKIRMSGPERPQTLAAGNKQIPPLPLDQLADGSGPDCVNEASEASTEPTIGAAMIRHRLRQHVDRLALG